MKETKKVYIYVTGLGVRVCNNGKAVAYYDNVWDAVKFAKQYNKPVIVVDKMLEMTYKV